MTQENVPVPLTPAEEAKLIRKARQEPAAFARLYRAYAAPLYRYLLSRCGVCADAEDLTSQVFLEALAGLSRYRHRGYFKAWLFSIARHRLLNYHSRRRPESDLTEEENQSSGEKQRSAGRNHQPGGERRTAERDRTSVCAGTGTFAPAFCW